nr:probable choline kinase 1 [Ipomoea batatas]
MAGKENESIQDALPNELIMLLSSLAQKWGDTLDPSIKTAKHLSGAMTNAVYAVSWPAKEGTVTRRVLVRIYGKGIHNFFDRDDEVRIFEFVSNNGHGPSLLEKGKEGRIEEFIDAKTLSASDQRDPEISTLIAKKLREFHTIELPGTKEPAIWGRLRKWLEKAKGLCSTERIEELGDLEEEINLLEDELSREEQEIVFCHNDLQNGNIMIKDKTITLINTPKPHLNPLHWFQEFQRDIKKRYLLSLKP